MYEYEVKLPVRKVVDGDTVDLDVDLGFYMTASIRFRLLGVDTPELRGGTDDTKKDARIAKEFVESRLGVADRIMIRTQRADSFGRWLCDLDYWVGETKFNLPNEILKAGHGKPA